MSCAGYQPSTSTEDLARLQSSNECVPGSYALGIRQYPYNCGYSVFLPKQPGPGFAGTPFEDTMTWLKPYAMQVRETTAKETRSGYPRSSYVPLFAKTTLPPQFNLCNQ